MKNKHDIDYYRKLRNEGMSWRDISIYLNIPETTIITWVKSNYKEIIFYDYLKK